MSEEELRCWKQIYRTWLSNYIPQRYFVGFNYLTMHSKSASDSKVVKYAITVGSHHEII